jgi:hypothetical protein
MIPQLKPGSLRRAWPWLAFLAVAAFALYIGTFLGTSLTFKPFSAADLLRLLGSLAVVALLVERTIEVSVGAWRGKVTDRLLSSAESAKLALISAPANIALHETVVAKEAELVDYRAETKKLALRVAVLLGLLVAATGFRTIETLVTSIGTGFTGGLFRLLDLVMTGTVIGGGSEAIHRMISTATTYLDATTRVVRGREPETVIPSLIGPGMRIPPVAPGPPTR